MKQRSGDKSHGYRQVTHTRGRYRRGLRGVHRLFVFWAFLVGALGALGRACDVLP